MKLKQIILVLVLGGCVSPDEHCGHTDFVCQFFVGGAKLFDSLTTQTTNNENITYSEQPDPWQCKNIKVKTPKKFGNVNITNDDFILVDYQNLNLFNDLGFTEEQMITFIEDIIQQERAGEIWGMAWNQGNVSYDSCFGWLADNGEEICEHEGKNRYFVDDNGNKISSLARIYYVAGKFLTSKIQQHKQNLEEEKEKTRRAEIEKKYGKPFCSDYFISYLLDNQTIPTNCMFENVMLKVVQQTPDGTLAKYPFLPYRYSVMLFVPKNKNISNLSDGQTFSGYFTGAGTYKYTTVLGATKTVQKIKMLKYNENNK